MRAIMQRRYGGPEVLGLEDVPVPAITPDRVLVRVRAASVNALDWHMLRGKPVLARMGEGWRAPKQPIRGVDVAGVVEAVGADVTEFAPGDEVFGSGNGTFAEFTATRPASLVRKPAGVSFEAAGAVSIAARTALQGLALHGGLQPGQRVLIHGAGGGVGTFAVQIAKALGAEVTAVTAASKTDLVRSLGADRVFEQAGLGWSEPARYDLAFDVGGFAGPGALARVTVAGGVVTMCGAGPNAAGWVGPMVSMLTNTRRQRIGDVRFAFFMTSSRNEDLVELARLLESGAVRPAIERMYPLADAGAAIAHVEQGRARGKVGITI